MRTATTARRSGCRRNTRVSPSCGARGAATSAGLGCCECRPAATSGMKVVICREGAGRGGRWLAVSLHVITGPMRAGKTLDLIESVRRSRANRIKTLVFTHKLAARVHGKRLMSRTGAVVRATPVESAEDIIQAAKDAKPGSVIIIDEAHFFNMD